jgi:hypothetical protein
MITPKHPSVIMHESTGPKKTRPGGDLRVVVAGL